MSLYDEIDSSVLKKGLYKSITNLKFLQSHLKLKKKALKRKLFNLPVQSEYSNEIYTDNFKKIGTANKKETKQSDFYDLEIIDEYEPIIPNNFEVVKKQLEQTSKDERHIKYINNENKYKRYGSNNDENDISPKNNKQYQTCKETNLFGTKQEDKSFTQVGYQYPDSDSDEESTSYNVYLNKRADTIKEDKKEQKIIYNNNKDNNSGEEIALKIMTKYGFKEGQGLGKNKQGIPSPLTVQKTGRLTGTIVQDDTFLVPKVPAPRLKLQKRFPTKVILLMNMVGPKEVDDELKIEIKEECETYGKVVQVVITEIENVSAENAVRIFVEFKSVEDAAKALTDLNGRYFGGRLVTAMFYSFEAFKKQNYNMLIAINNK